MSNPLNRSQFAKRLQHKISQLPKLKPSQWKFKKGDLVEVVSGRVDLGLQGTVKKVLRKRQMVVVSGLNMHKRTVGPTPAATGFQFMLETPLHYSKLALVDPMDQKPTRVKKMKTAEGESVRVSLRTGAIIRDSPQLKYKPERIMNKKTDTDKNEVQKETYQPFDMSKLSEFINAKWNEAKSKAEKLNKAKDEETGIKKRIMFRRVKGRKIPIEPPKISPKFEINNDDIVPEGIQYYAKH